MPIKLKTKSTNIYLYLLYERSKSAENLGNIRRLTIVITRNR